MSTQVAKIFINGGSQAVCLPKEPTWDAFFDTKSVFDDDFLVDREDAPAQKRNFDGRKLSQLIPNNRR